MEIREITDKKIWEDFVLNEKTDTFLESWNWGEFNTANGEKIWRLGIFDADKLICVALIIKVNAKRGKFLFCPHGPVMSQKSKISRDSGSRCAGKNQEIMDFLFKNLKNLAKKEKADFIRISPLAEDSRENLEIFCKSGFRNAPIHMMHPELSWILDISKSEEDIMKGMRKTTRNLVRRAERDGVKIERSAKAEDVDKFYAIHSETVSRHGFVPFSKKYLAMEMETFLPDNRIMVLFASHNSKILSSAIIVFYGHSAFYHHGASLASKVPASHLLLWEAIKEAKSRGCVKFNFWGIAPEGKPSHPWAGLTMFKMGFGGYSSQYLHCQDLPITVKYWFNWAVESFRRRKKGY